MTDTILPPKLYVLAGHDHDGAFKEQAAYLKSHPEITIIRPKDGQSLEDAVKNIKASPEHSASIILACHGGDDGEFIWQEGESIKYSQLFKALPQHDISSIIIQSCYGGTSKESIANLPAGTVLQSLVSDKTPGHGGTLKTYMNLVENSTKPSDLLLASAVVVDPSVLIDSNKYWNNHQGWSEKIGNFIGASKKYTTNPNIVLPENFAIGGGKGKIPQLVHLPTKVAQLAGALHSSKIDEDAFARAKMDVTQRFLALKSLDYDAYNRDDSKTLDTVIADMTKGKIPTDPESRRVEYALAIAYMKHNGELDRRIEKQGGMVASRKHIPHTEYDKAALKQINALFNSALLDKRLPNPDGSDSRLGLTGSDGMVPYIKIFPQYNESNHNLMQTLRKALGSDTIAAITKQSIGVTFNAAALMTHDKDNHLLAFDKKKVGNLTSVMYEYYAAISKENLKAYSANLDKVGYKGNFLKNTFIDKIIAGTKHFTIRDLRQEIGNVEGALSTLNTQKFNPTLKAAETAAQLAHLEALGNQTAHIKQYHGIDYSIAAAQFHNTGAMEKPITPELKQLMHQVEHESHISLGNLPLPTINPVKMDKTKGL